ncbi:MAG: hypothetical protein EOP53_09200 [Sphingobacteriales bacterium]|nr:MAG: hypothetical protein EOP53_09200 [Sphingobacteriales bacterium]
MSILNVENKTLAKLSRFDLLIDGEENVDDAGVLQMEFSDGTVLELELKPDGESVSYNWKDLEKTEEEDKTTGWFKIDLSNRNPYNNLIRKKIKFSDDLLFGAKEESEDKLVIAGFGFQFEDNQTLIYYNAGDFAKIYVNEMPTKFEDTFKLVWRNKFSLLI